jgi:Spy/CpxP family protein refolding chaperone
VKNLLLVIAASLALACTAAGDNLEYLSLVARARGDALTRRGLGPGLNFNNRASSEMAQMAARQRAERAAALRQANQALNERLAAQAADPAQIKAVAKATAELRARSARQLAEIEAKEGAK